MRKSLLLIVFISLLVVPLRSQTKASGSYIRVLSYNIHHGAGMDGVIDLERIARVILSVSPDIVSLQEVDVKTKRSGGVDQASELSRLTGMQVIFSKSMDFDGGEYGNAVLSKLKTEVYSSIPLPGEPRSAIFAKVMTPDSAWFRFIATHLDTKGGPREESLPLLEEHFVKTGGSMPAILAGDLNDVPEGNTIQSLLSSWCSTLSLYGWHTFPSLKPDRQIDHILFRPKERWRVVRAEVLDEPMASDHRPIFVQLELTGY